MSATKAWYERPKNEAHGEVWKWIQACANECSVQRADTRIFVQVCSNFNPTGNDEFDYAVRAAFPNRIRDNIVQAGVDTAVSLIAQARTAPQYVTTGGTFQTSRKAERRSRVLQGQMWRLDVFTMMKKAFRQACEGGTGYMVGYVSADGVPELELALHNEVFVLPGDGRYGKPRGIGRVSFRDRATLIARHPKHADELKTAAGPTPRDYLDFFLGRYSKSTDIVRVVDMWLLPTSKGAGDGRYVRCVSNATIVDEPFAGERHRVVRVVGWERNQGFYGQSLVERMLPAQLRLSETDDFVAEVQRLCSSPKWFVEKNSGITEDDITNDVQVLPYNAGSPPPTLAVFSGTPPDLVAERREIKQDSYDQQGFGDNTVSGDVNKGLASGRAVKYADDVKVRRFIEPASLLERAYLDVVHLLEDLNDECARRNPEFAPAARYRSGRRTWVRTSKWADLALDDNDATVTLFPISIQATTAASKFDQVDDWISRGWVSKPMAMDLQGMPDWEAFADDENADVDLVREQIENIIDEHDADPDMLLPIPEQDLTMASYLVRKAFLKAWAMRAPDVVIERFQSYLAYAKQLGAKAAPPPAPAPAALNPEAAAALQLGAGPAGPAAPPPGAPPPMAGPAAA